jgi:hypothetical protein
MPTPSPSTSGKKSTPLLATKRQESASEVRRLPKSKHNHKKYALIALVAALLLGLTQLAAPSPYQAFAFNAISEDGEQPSDGFAGRIDEDVPELDLPVYPTPEPPSSAVVAPEPAQTEPDAASEETSPELPQTIDSTIEHIIIITIDGLRPDALDLAITPNLDKLRAKGAYSPQAQTISLSITLPSHTSMLTGITQKRHGIEWGIPYIGWPGINCPTVFSIARDAGYSTGMVFGKQKLHYMVLPNTVDKIFGADAHDPEIRDEAIAMIEDGLPNLSFIHFPDTDRVGHAYGWMSENQLYAINYTDGLIGEITDALEREGYLDSTLMIISADHGGHGKGHGDDAPQDRTIPWLAVGPGVPQGVILSSHINIYDTGATALHALKLAVPEDWDGRPVMEIFETEDQSLLVSN